MQLEPETVLRAHLGPLVDPLQLDQFDDAKPDKHALAGWREVFSRTWRQRDRRV